MDGDLSVQVAGLLNGGRSDGASGWVVQWRVLRVLVHYHLGDVFPAC